MSTAAAHGEHLQFVTGRLAAESLEATVRAISSEMGFAYSIDILPISVAALMTIPWVSRHIAKNSAASRVVLPGYCQGDLTPLSLQLEKPVERGPKDLTFLRAYLGGQSIKPSLQTYDIEIIAEINHAPSIALHEFVEIAKQLAADGANVIDVGCDPVSAPWAHIGDYVRALRDLGLRVSVDSFNSREIECAARAGAELVLSVNSSNRASAPDWGIEVVAIPDDPQHLSSIDATLEFLVAHGVKARIDPILEPIGFGLFQSLQRYATIRAAYPQFEMMMGIGNVTELTDVDSAGINLLLLCICQELKIRSVLTTQVISWAQSSVRECDIARRLAYHAVTNRVLPKHLSEELVLLRDSEVSTTDAAYAQSLAQNLRDHNLRIFRDDFRIMAVSHQLCLSDSDPFLLFERLQQAMSRPITPSHAFYLGYEFCKAQIAVQLGKQYTQDEALRWGFLTKEESVHRLNRDG